MRPKITPELAGYPPRGSDIYYVLRQISPHAQNIYLALHAWSQELYKISEAYREVNIAQQKLLWWNDEVKRIYRNEATHPLAKVFEKAVGFYNIKEIELAAMLEGVLLSSTTQAFTTHQELRQHYQHTGGILANLKAKVLLKDKVVIDVGLQKQIHSLGIAQEIIRHLLDFPIFLQRQHLYLPLELFQNHNLDGGLILQGQALDQLGPLLTSEFTQAKELIQAVKSMLSKEQKSLLRPLFLEVGLKLKQAQKTQNRAWQIFSYRLELSPIVKFLYTEFTQ